MLLNSVDKYLENGEIASSENVNTSISSGKSTLLWENHRDSNGQKEETIQVENLNKYKYIYLELFVDYGEGDEPYGNLDGGATFIPMQVIIQENSVYHGPSTFFCVKYVDENTLNIMYWNNATYTLKIYGIE